MANRKAPEELDVLILSHMAVHDDHKLIGAFYTPKESIIYARTPSGKLYSVIYSDKEPRYIGESALLPLLMAITNSEVKKLLDENPDGLDFLKGFTNGL